MRRILAPFSGFLERLPRSVIYGILRLLFGIRTKPRPLSVKNLRRILLFRYDRIGDMVLTTPIFDLIKANAPEIEIHVLASPSNAAILRCDERISTIYRFRISWRELWRLRQEMRQVQFDAVACLVFNKTWDGLLAAWLCGTKTPRITVAHEHRIKFYEPLYDIQVPRPPSSSSLAELHTHVVAGAFGWKRDGAALSLRICPDASKRQQNYLRHIAKNRQTLLINCSAGSSERSLSAQQVSDLAQLLQQHYPELCLMVVGMPSDSAMIASICVLAPSIMPIPPTDDIHEVCALVQSVTWLITPDTSLVHIASAVGTPLVALYANNSRNDMLFVPCGVRHERIVAEENQAVCDISSQIILENFTRLVA